LGRGRALHQQSCGQAVERVYCTTGAAARRLPCNGNERGGSAAALQSFGLSATAPSLVRMPANPLEPAGGGGVRRAAWHSDENATNGPGG